MNPLLAKRFNQLLSNTQSVFMVGGGERPSLGLMSGKNTAVAVAMVTTIGGGIQDAQADMLENMAANVMRQIVAPMVNPNVNQIQGYPRDYPQNDPYHRQYQQQYPYPAYPPVNRGNPMDDAQYQEDRMQQYQNGRAPIMNDPRRPPAYGQVPPDYQEQRYQDREVQIRLDRSAQEAYGQRPSSDFPVELIPQQYDEPGMR